MFSRRKSVVPENSGCGLPDCHIHSRSSFDSTEPVPSQCRAALRVGLSSLTITDHCELVADGSSKYWTPRAMRRSQKDARAAAEQFAGTLEVLSGVELGQPAYDPERAHAVLDAGDYDLVLASVHYLRDGRDFYYLNYNECDPNEVYDKYLTEILETVRFGRFDVLAHMNYPMRYILRDGAPFDETRYYDRYEQILRELADAGRGLEINTKNILYNSPVNPDLPIVKMFRELGGKYITLGSDAHRASQLGVGIAEGARIALEAGFDCVYKYVAHEPVRVEVELSK